MTDVVAYRVRGHMQLLGDLRVAAASGYEREDFPLPPGEAFEPLQTDLPLRRGFLAEDAAHELDTGGADLKEIQEIRSHLVHASLTQAAASNRMNSVEQYVNDQLAEDSRKLNELLRLLLIQVEDPLHGDFRRKERDGAPRTP